MVLSFGLYNVPSQFAHIMELVLSGLTYDICLIYSDDILVFSETFDEHCNRLTAIFDQLQCYTLKLKATNCHLFQRKVAFLSDVLSDRVIKCDTDKVAPIASWPRPTNVSEVRTFYTGWLLTTAPLCKTLHMWPGCCTTSPRRMYPSNEAMLATEPSKNLKGGLLRR